MEYAMFPVEPNLTTAFEGATVVDNNSTNATTSTTGSLDLAQNMTNPDSILARDDELLNNVTLAGDLSHLDKCIPKAAWQTASFINCNAFHEIDLPRSSMEYDDSDGTTTSPHHTEEQLVALGEGWFRTAWKLDAHNQTTVVLKTLRIAREFLPEYYELHRRDAVAMERLTWSAFVVDVFGFCGNSAINEIADFPYPDVKDLEHFDRKMRYREKVPQVQRIKLQIAASIAQGIADIHSIDGLEQGATMVHYDLNPRNIAMFRRGRPKINDFNIAEFLRYNPETNETCGFPNRMKQPWWRAPEEVNLTANVEINEKVDMYSLGAILFHILTTHSPRGKMKLELMEGIRDDVVRGVAPVLPAPFDSMTDTITMAFKKAMDRCFVVDPKKRASADEIVGILFEALTKVMEGNDSKASAEILKTPYKKKTRRKVKSTHH
jgi:serine/threonine protein kinase